MKVLFTSAAFDSSGYAEASRNYICALAQQSNIELACRTTSFEGWKTDIGPKYKKIIHPLQGKPMQPDVQIVHLTPENYKHSIVRGVKNIGYTVWETSKLPAHWVQMCNQMDEIWVPCDWNVKVFKESGVQPPVKKIPHAFDPECFSGRPIERDFSFPTNKFLFYSVFQWSVRKNPEALLQAYFTEFGPDENVCLVLKTFELDNSLTDKAKIKNYIKSIKDRLWLKTTPPVMLIHEGLSRDEMLALHQQCNCFVLPHRAEGWGIPHFEAMATGNTCIATNYSGNLEFMNENNSLLVDCNETPCYGMNRPTYNGKMMWAEPHIDDLKRKMREAFIADQLAGQFGLSGLGLEYPGKVLERFNWETVGSLMAKELGV